MLAVGLPVHEFSHALAAYRLGDGTAKLFGRLTLNPIAHFDPVGGSLLALTFIGSAATGARSASAGPNRHRSTRSTSRVDVGARPRGRRRTPVELRPGGRRRHPVAIRHAYPQFRTGRHPFSLLSTCLDFFVQINLLLMIFNFIPIPPLDGSKVMFAFMDRRTEYQIRPFLEQYGFFIVLRELLFFPPGNSIGSQIISPILNAFYKFLVGV